MARWPPFESLALVALVMTASTLIGAYHVRASDCPVCDFGTSAWTLVSGPKMQTIGPFMVETYVNNLAVRDTGIVYSVVRNTAGQTVAYETTTVSLDAGQSGNAYSPVSFGLALGNNKVSIFVTSTAGTAISNTTSVNIAWP